MFIYALSFLRVGAWSATFRLPVVVVDGAGLAQWPLDPTSTPLPGGLITPGTSWFFQFWYRDPLGGPAHYNFSDGFELRLCPWFGRTTVFRPWIPLRIDALG